MSSKENDKLADMGSDENQNDQPGNPDLADAFARVPRDQVNGQPRKDRSAKRDRNKDRKARAPVTEIVAAAIDPAPEDDPMDPFDAAAEIMGLFDGLFTVAKMLRGYPDEIPMPDGSTKKIPDPEAKARLQRALVRFMKSAGVNVGPGANLAIAGFGCYVAPILAFEMQRALIAKMTK